MTPGSWQQIDQLFQAARLLAPDERLAFLDQACAGQEAVCAEVLELLAHDEQATAEGFLGIPTQSASSHPAQQVGPARSPSRRRGAPSRRGGELPVSLVIGSGSHQRTLEVEALYRSRGRVGVPIIVLGFGGFLLDNLLFSGPYADPTHRPILLAHIAVMATASFMIPILWSRKAISLRGLRAMELVLLLLATIFFALFQLGEFQDLETILRVAPAHRFDVLDLTGDACVLRWFALLVFYGFFVPNTWGRCACVLSMVGLAPLAVTLGLGLWEGRLGEYRDVLGEMAIWVGIGWVMAVYGSYKITQWRTEAYEARKLGQYRLKRRLGSGGMGEVWLAEHQRLKQPCAIKLIRDELIGDPTILSRFEREVKATAMLSHPNTVRIYDYGIADDGTFYYTMEYLPGLTLHELVQDHGPLLPERAVHMLRQACSALAEAHGKGLIHRDLKPGNLMTCRLGGVADVIKILDFGLVRTAALPNDSERLSLRGQIVGTPAYLAPEQATGRGDADARSDIYSLGALGYFLVSGHAPFEGNTYHHVVIAHLERPVPPLNVPGRVIPADFEAVIRRCLEKDPVDRFADVMSLDQALADCECAGTWTAAAAGRWWQEHPAADLATEPNSGPVTPT